MRQTWPLKLATSFVGSENYVSFFQTCMLVYYSLMNMFYYYHIWFRTLTKHSPRLHNVLLFSEIFSKIIQDFIIQGRIRHDFTR